MSCQKGVVLFALWNKQCNKHGKSSPLSTLSQQVWDWFHLRSWRLTRARWESCGRLCISRIAWISRRCVWRCRPPFKFQEWLQKCCIRFEVSWPNDGSISWKQLSDAMVGSSWALCFSFLEVFSQVHHLLFASTEPWVLEEKAKMLEIASVDNFQGRATWRLQHEAQEYGTVLGDCGDWNQMLGLVRCNLLDIVYIASN